MPEAPPPPLPDPPPPAHEFEPAPIFEAEPETAYAPEPEPEPEAELEVEPEPAPEPGPEAEFFEEDDAAPALDDLIDDDAGDGASEGAGEEELSLSDAELDEMFGSEDDAPEPFSSIMDNDAGDEVDEDLIEPDDLPDDPIPQVFTASDVIAGDERGMSRWMIILIAAVVGLLGILAGLFFARGMIADLLPFMKPVYESIGLTTSTIGEGLDIRNVKSSRETEGDLDVLVVRGIIINISGGTRTVPNVRVALYDTSDEVVMEHVAVPRSDGLEAQEKSGFKARLVDVPATARRLEVTFTEASPAPMEAPKESDKEMKKDSDKADEEMKQDSDEPASSDGDDEAEQSDDEPESDEESASDAEAPPAAGVKPAMNEENKEE